MLDWTSLVAQWLRLHAPSAGGLGSIPGRGTRSHKPQLRVWLLQLKIPHAATTKINKYNKNEVLLTTPPANPGEMSSWVYSHNTLGQVPSSVLLSFNYLRSESHNSHLDYCHYHLHLFPCTQSQHILLCTMRLHWYDGRSRLTKSFPSSKFHSHITPDPPPRVCQEMSSAWPSTPFKVSFPESPFRNPF